MYKDKNIIVSMTSWPKRIGNVATVIKSLLEQELEPDIIQINLSEDEFKNKELDFPKDLQRLISSDTRICIEWVKGNDGVFKKIIPTLQKHYGEDYFLLSVDDDWVYSYEYIKMMVEYLENYETDAFSLYKNDVIIGNRMIYKSSCFQKDFWEKLTKEVIDCRIDDGYIEYYFKAKGKKVGGFRPDNSYDIIKKFNQIFPNSQSDNGYSPQQITTARREMAKIVFN